MQTKLWLIRPAQPADIPFIYSTWLKSFKFGSSGNKHIRTSIFFNEYKQILDNILLDSKVMIACLEHDPEVILGYLVYNKNILHYCFVKEAFRNMGVAYSLIDSIPFIDNLVYTHRTELLKQVMVKIDKLKSFTYNPFLLYTKAIVYDKD